MKKVNFLILLVILFPSFVSAAWWNPFSWKLIRRADNQTQVLEKRVKELEEKLSQTATSTATTTKQVLPVKKPKEKTTPTQQLPNINTQPVVSATNQPLVDYEVLYKDVSSKYYLLSQQVNDDISMERMVISGGGQTSAPHLAFLENLRITINSDMRNLDKFWNIIPKPADEINSYSIKYQQLVAQYEGEKTNTAVEKNRNAKQSILNNTQNYITQNKDRLYISSIHIEAARLLDIFDRTFGSKYSEQFRLTQTQVQTVEFANSFILDLQLNKWSIN